jgi:hypothetical protein
MSLAANETSRFFRRFGATGKYVCLVGAFAKELQ